MLPHRAVKCLYTEPASQASVLQASGFAQNSRTYQNLTAPRAQPLSGSPNNSAIMTGGILYPRLFMLVSHIPYFTS